MKRLFISLALTASAIGQSVVLAPPSQQVHSTAHTGTIAITYTAPPQPHTARPVLVLDSPQGDVSCYASTDAVGVLHSSCEDEPRAIAEHSRATLYLRNFHGINGAFVALLDAGAKCDPLQAMEDGAIAKHLDSVTFDYKEGRDVITVACTYADSKGNAKQGAAKYNVIAAR